MSRPFTVVRPEVSPTEGDERSGHLEQGHPSSFRLHPSEAESKHGFLGSILPPSSFVKLRTCGAPLASSGRVADCRRLIRFSQVLGTPQENAMMMELVSIGASVPVASQDSAMAKSIDGAWENRAGEASDRTRPAASKQGVGRTPYLTTPASVRASPLVCLSQGYRMFAVPVGLTEPPPGFPSPLRSKGCPTGSL
jgi:hypothetical protein